MKRLIILPVAFKKMQNSNKGTQVSLVLKNELAELEQLSAELARLSQNYKIPEIIIQDIRLALDEVITNIISYAYEDGRPHLIHVDFEIEKNRIALIIQDDGKPFNPLNVEAPDTQLPIEERRIGGMGIFLIRYLMDIVKYKRKNAKNHLRLEKFLQP